MIVDRRLADFSPSKGYATPLVCAAQARVALHRADVPAVRQHLVTVQRPRPELTYALPHLSFPEIAGDMFLSRNTIKTEANSIYRKLGVSSRGQAVTRSSEPGLLDG